MLRLLIAPYVEAEWELILKGWLCSAVSVYCLARFAQDGAAIFRYGPVRPRAAVGGVPIRVDVFGGQLCTETSASSKGGEDPTGEVAHRIHSRSQGRRGYCLALLNILFFNARQVSKNALQLMVIPLMSLSLLILAKAPEDISGGSSVECLLSKANNADLLYEIQRTFEDEAKPRFLVQKIVKVIHIGGTLLLCAALCWLKGAFLILLTCVVHNISGSVIRPYCKPAIERLFNLQNFRPQLRCGDIKFCDVTFRYEKPRALPSPCWAIWWGKTTLTKLLLRLYDPQSGIRLRSLRNTSACNYYCCCSGVIFRHHVAEILVTRLDGEINMELVEKAARTANAVEFIRNLPDMATTPISRLHGLYQESSILILDEETRLGILTANHTVLVIAHEWRTRGGEDQGARGDLPLRLGSYILVYGGLGVYIAWRWRKLRQTEDRVFSLYLSRDRRWKFYALC
ncbi:unnamed protein product [Spirodela intermedia]|uniref:Uncharacterized protein n=1 Tax=Spirodela intermedia TaxID=51605 RepID=A0A7I8JGH6_SPIIN|nr:unnamed protein product [Spirodela intermedia]CAA6668492.1 unnamed protein product [Spirodela intermedia]